MSEWGGACAACGHPASYHGMTFCMVDAGADHKRQCDCDGWSQARVLAVLRDPYGDPHEWEPKPDSTDRKEPCGVCGFYKNFHEDHWRNVMEARNA